MSSDEGLKPCPFCGGKAERIDLTDDDNFGGSCIQCTQCQASSHVEFGFKENLESFWNRRAAIPDGWVLVEKADLAFLRGFYNAWCANIPAEEMPPHEFQQNAPGITGSDICTICGLERSDHASPAPKGDAE